jgi:hypothetical protein
MNIEETLWSYIDGSCTAAEKTEVESLIASQSEWRQKHQELLNIHQLLNSHLELEEPSMRFRQNIMEAITKHHIAPATKTYINKKIIYGIGAFFIAMISGLLIYVLSQINWTGSSSNVNTIPYNFNKINWGSLFNSSYAMIFLAVNMVLGLMLFDMYLGKKRSTMQEKK